MGRVAYFATRQSRKMIKAGCPSIFERKEVRGSGFLSFDVFDWTNDFSVPM
jgi:hypothetical protein